MRNHNPIVIEEFNGYWNRGDTETCPPNLQTEFINMRFLESGIQTRNGLAPAVTTNTSILRIYPYFDASVGDGFLELRSDTKIYHVYGSIGSWTTFQVSNAIATMTDFGFISVNGRAYISPSTSGNLNGISGEFIYVYDGGGVNMMRKAAGTGPTTAEGAMAVANSATAGNVEAGIHVFGVVYETNSGFLTQIGPSSAYPTYTADGTHKADLSAIPIFGGGGGSLITKRHIVASKLIDPVTYNGDPSSYQLFFVTGGTISDNTTTTLTVNFFDSELTDDASHLLDLLSELPAVGGLGTYHNRMLGWDIGGPYGTSADGINICMISYAGEPEAMDAVNGFIEVPREGTGITYCQEYRDVLYVMKFNKIMAFNDNGDVPTAWPSAAIDQGLGCGKHGVAMVGIYGGTNIESFIMLNDQGIYAFTGNLTTPELSYKIKDYWRTISPGNINTGAIAAYNDSLNQVLYVVIPELNTVLIGDYSNGLSAEKIKWSKWTFDNSPKTILLFDKDNKLFIGFTSGVHYILSGATTDTYNGASAVKIPDPTISTAFLPSNEPDNNILHYGGVRLRIVGSGNAAGSSASVIPKLYSLDGSFTTTLATQLVTSGPGREYVALSNFITTLARLELKTTAVNDVMKINRIILYVKEMWANYPG